MSFIRNGLVASLLALSVGSSLAADDLTPGASDPGFPLEQLSPQDAHAVLVVV